MDGLTTIYQQSPGNTAARAEFLNRMFATGDVALVGQAAALIGDPKTGLHKAMGDTTAMHAALQKLAMPRDIETYNELRKALDLIAGKTGTKPAVAPPAKAIDWALVKTIPAQAKWKIETDLGPVTIRLAVDEAPATVANIVKLAKEGYFDGKFFHRIVPNFVAQGGCPRGDGWGSTEPMLRSEFTGLRFARGAVGMASSGKDTESCQFFITHSAMPHLDGRYTVFGYVESGIAVAERLDVGSKILKTTIGQ
jgi:cyclophilin family peptidyl-prolyl cis-trans isomerase